LSSSSSEVTVSTGTVPERPLRADARRNYDQLVAAAREALREHGAAVSLEDIARRAGVGIGTLYRRFPTRLALLEAVYREDVDGLRTHTDELLQDDDPWAAVEAWVRHFLDYASTKRALFAELVDAIGRDSELLTYSRSVIGGTAEQVLARAREAGVVRADVQPADLTRLIGGCSMMGPVEPDQGERVIAIVLAGIRA
jgi:AcrR family transcriptional regulator